MWNAVKQNLKRMLKAWSAAPGYSPFYTVSERGFIMDLGQKWPMQGRDYNRPLKPILRIRYKSPIAAGLESK